MVGWFGREEGTITHRIAGNFVQSVSPRLPGSLFVGDEIPKQDSPVAPYLRERNTALLQQFDQGRPGVAKEVRGFLGSQLGVSGHNGNTPPIRQRVGDLHKCRIDLFWDLLLDTL